MSIGPTAAAHQRATKSRIVAEFVGIPRPGRQFEPIAERLLDEDLLVLSTRLPRASEGIALIHEFAGGRGVADVVAITGWQEAAQRRIALQLPPLVSEMDCTVVAALSPHQTRTLDTLEKTLGMSREQLTRRIRSLISDGYVFTSGSGYRKVKDFEAIGRAYALEAKVSNWRQGISQALRYSTWCDAAAIVVMKDPRHLDEVRAQCLALSIGFASEGRWIVRPRKGHPNPGLRLAMSEQFIQHLIHSKSF